MLLKTTYREKESTNCKEILRINADTGLLVKEQKKHEMKYSITIVNKPTTIAPKYGAASKYLK